MGILNSAKRVTRLLTSVQLDRAELKELLLKSKLFLSKSGFMLKK